LEIKPEEGSEFQDLSFSCGSGGAPRNKVGVEEVYRHEERAYSTSGPLGDAYSGEVIIRCKETGVWDKYDRPIYLSEGGKAFVYEYKAGSPADFDRGVFLDPEIE